MNVRFRPEAATELGEARDWYAARDEQLGDQLIEAIDAAVERIAARPKSFAALERFPAVQRAQLRRFPLQLLFRVLADNTIEVLAVAHARRRPGFWRSRLR